MNSSQVVLVEDLTKEFTSTGGQRVLALRDVSFSISEGQSIAVVGPTGAGKSTLLRIIAGLESPDRGRVMVMGQSPLEARGRLGYLSQEHNLLPWLTLIDNVSLPAIVKGTPKEEARAWAEDLLKKMGLKEYARLYPYELSGGMRQRGALARLLATDTHLWLLDEPFSFLDERTRHGLQDLLLELIKDNSLTVLMVTHSADEAVYLADRVVVLSASPGRVIEDFVIETPKPRDRFSPEYLGCLERIRVAIERVLQE